MEKLNTIQKRNNLNKVYSLDEKGAGGACHKYMVVQPLEGADSLQTTIVFQHGPRKESNSTIGVLDTDLLEIVRDRLQQFQKGDFSCRENAIALAHIEEALLWMNKRVEDRAERGVLGTNSK